MFDRIAYSRAMTAAAVVEPDLASAELQKSVGVLGEDKTLAKLLYIGEFAHSYAGGPEIVWLG